MKRRTLGYMAFCLAATLTVGRSGEASDIVIEDRVVGGSDAEPGEYPFFGMYCGHGLPPLML